MPVKATAEAAAGYFEAADDEEFIEHLTKDINRLLEEAIVAEREECAQVANNYMSGGWTADEAWAVDQIAIAIRARK